jgi:branched-subunit amino acid transport protein
MLVALPTLIFAWKSRSLAGTVIFGMALFWGAERFIS